tara:strand:+ start:192 stop:605 length:414 start_codon:yes stop_codon:yes gene_type:complete
LRLPEVKKSDMVGTTVGTESSANTTVIYLDIQPFLVVVCGVNRTYGFAWSIATMLAHYRDKPGLNIRILTLPIAFYPDPLDSSSLVKMFFQIYGDVIFGLTSYHTSVAASASVYVHYHSPFAIFLAILSHLLTPTDH